MSTRICKQVVEFNYFPLRNHFLTLIYEIFLFPLSNDYTLKGLGWNINVLNITNILTSFSLTNPPFC